ncbi:MAG: L,D-transpeptidase family protein, partial [Woeseiaceae bacterium]
AVLLTMAGAAVLAESLEAPAAARIPAWFLEIPEAASEVLVADAATATMHRFSVVDNRVVAHDRRYMSIGQNGAGKQRAWDRRTPLGIYFITERLDTSRLDPKYGVAAYALDYPNAWDRFNGRGGYGIWLHGVPPGGRRRPPLDTDGCLALPNEELTTLAGLLEPLQTPVIVTREMRWAEPTELDALRGELRRRLAQWANSAGNGDLHEYLSLYAEDFTHNDMNRAEWSAYKLGAFAGPHPGEVLISDVLLLADPAEPGLYLSRFVQTRIVAGRRVVTTKRLYWRRKADAEWRIVTEDNG